MKAIMTPSPMPAVKSSIGRSAAMALGLLLAWVSVSTAQADPGVEFFESKIRPVLVEHCYKCHAGPDAKIKGGLRLDSREAMQVGGDSGAAVVPKDPANS